MDLIASHFLAGSILTWAMPIGLLIVVTIWYMVILRGRRSNEDS
jgi:cytochrome c-type biogenesis protein CcmH/NrfF